MINLKRRQPHRKAHLNKQRGGALILIAFMIGIALTAFVIKNFDTFSVKAEQDAKTMEALGKAKEALIAWSVSHPSWPGVMPFPDRGTDPGGYDGVSDCVTSGLSFTHLLGQLPLTAENPCISPQKGPGLDLKDSTGESLWYAVSMNLIRTSGTAATPVINPNIIENSTTPWMIVRNSSGTIISDRVAAVIIAPGSALSGQDRSGIDATATNYLDQVTIGGVTYSNFDYDAGDEDFIIGDITSGNFNDRIAYITIDELMEALEKRVGETTKFSLAEYRDANGYLPYAAQLGTTQNFSPEEGKLEGLLPVHYQACSYRRESFSILGIPIRQSTLSDCSASIFDPELSGISSIRFTSPTGTFNNDQDSCVANGAVCTCAGTGNCTGPGATRFQCADSNCFSISINNLDAWGSIDIAGKFTHSTGGCTQFSPLDKLPPDKPPGCTGDAVIRCEGATAGAFASSSDVPFASYLPSWMVDNEWYKHVFYYTINRARTEPLTAGTMTDLDAVILTFGKEINQLPYASKGSPQIRPSCEVASINNYLDSIENTDLDSVDNTKLDRTFDAVGTKRSSSYNDHIFVVTP